MDPEKRITAKEALNHEWFEFWFSEILNFNNYT
jgi:hypothetical protein